MSKFITDIPQAPFKNINLNRNELHLSTIETLDDVPDGAAGGYSRVKTTEIQTGFIKLTTNTVWSGKVMVNSGITIDSATGIAIYGNNMALITAKAGTAITAFANAGGGLVTVTSATHDLVAGDRDH